MRLVRFDTITQLQYVLVKSMAVFIVPNLKRTKFDNFL